MTKHSSDLRVDIVDQMRRATGAAPADNVEQRHSDTTVDGRVSADERRRLIASERSRVLSVLDTCRLAGREDLGGAFIESGQNVADVVRALQTRGAGRRLGWA